MRYQVASLLGVIALGSLLGASLLFVSGCDDGRTKSGSVVEVDEQAHADRQGKMQDMYKKNQKTKAIRQR